MGRRNKLLCLAAVLAAAVLTGCGHAGSTDAAIEQETAEEAALEEQTKETWLQTYTVRESAVSEANEAVLWQQGTEDGFLAYINRKVREAVPAELKADPDFVNDGRYDVYESALFHVSAGGKRSKVRRYRPLPAPENTENLEKYFSESRPRAFRVREDGSIVVLEASYESWLTTRGTQTRDRYYVRLLKENGVAISAAEIETAPGVGLDCGAAVLAGDQLVAVPQGNEVLFFGLDGKKQFSVTTPFGIRELCRTREGNLAVILAEGGNLWLSVITPADRSATVPQRLPEGMHSFCAGESEERFYCLRNSEVYFFDTASGMSGKRVSLLTLGISPSSVGGFAAGADGSLRFLVHDWDGAGQTVGEKVLTAVPCEIRTERQLISVGFEALSDRMAGAIRDFNRENDGVFLDAVDYRNLGEVLSGDRVQDVMIMEEEGYRRLETGGCLADLESLVRTDPEYSRDDLFPSVWNALSDNGGTLRRLAASFTVETMACDGSTAGGETRLNLTALRDLYAGMPAGSRLYEPYYTAGRLMEDLEAVNRGALGEGEAFNTGLYALLLNFSNLQPASYTYYDYAADPSSMEKRIYDGRLLMLQAHVGTLDDVKWYDAFFENGVSFVGWPTGDGSLSRFRFDETVGISAECPFEEQAAAWQFVRTLLSEDVQKNAAGFPVVRKALEQRMDEDAAAVSYRVDEKGKFETDKNGRKIEIARDSWYSPEWRRHYVYALTAAQRQKLLTLIEHCV